MVIVLVRKGRVGIIYEDNEGLSRKLHTTMLLGKLCQAV